MRNTPESPEENEQAKPTPTRSRSSTSARSKSESATPGSQEQETKPATRRRTASASKTGGVAEPSTQNGTEKTTTPSETTPRPTSAQRAGTASGTTTGNAPVARTQHDREHTAPTSSETTPRSAATQRSSATSTPRPQSSGTPTPTTRRPGGTGTGPTAQRPAGTTGPTAPAQRSSGSVTPAQRQTTGTSYRSTAQSATPLQQAVNPAVQGRPASRPTSGHAPAGAVRPSSTVRPGIPGGRPAAPGHPGSARPGTGGRPGTPAQRPQERRVAAVKEKPTGPISIPAQIVVKDLAELLHTTPNETIRGLIKHGIFASINQVVEYEKAAMVAQDLGFEPSMSATAVTTAGQNNRGLSANEAMIASRNEDNMVVIPPVVTIMGHVDHGKTSLLDTIRKTKVAAGEAGGITQYIGAYQVEVNGKKITFLDTPGHEAFTAMRARGAQVAHIAIIVIAADDGVMPQTREAISHAQAAKVPIIIALNKIDRPNANPDHVKQQLAEMGLLIEEYGGDIICVPVSARQGTGIDELLEYILLVAELQDLRANPNAPATGVIIEARLEKNSGPNATVLVQQGTLKMGDSIIVGATAGKVRAMFNDRGKRIMKAPPGTPVSIMGLTEVPGAGDRLEAVADERTAKTRAQQETAKRRLETMPLGQVSLDTLYMQEGKVKELNLILKADVQGSVEAIKGALAKIVEENLKVRLLHEGVGNISETDVHLATASGAIIIGFSVKADGAALREAQKEGVDIRYYDVIYKLIDDIQAALAGLLEPTYREVIEGHATVLQIFKAGKNTVIAGCLVNDGKLTRSSKARVMREGKKVHEGAIGSLRRGKDDVREVGTNYECGIVLDDFIAFEVNDIIETFNQERVKPGA